MTASTVVVVPSTFEMDSREDLVVTFDAAPALEVSDTIVAGTPELRRISDGVNYVAGLRGVPAVQGQLLAQEIYHPEAGERYWLILPFTANGMQVFAPRLQIVVAAL